MPVPKEFVGLDLVNKLALCHVAGKQTNFFFDTRALAYELICLHHIV